MTKSAWTEDMGQFLYYLDPDTRKITRQLEKIKLKIINSVALSLTKHARVYIYIYIYIYIKYNFISLQFHCYCKPRHMSFFSLKIIRQIQIDQLVFSLVITRLATLLNLHPVDMAKNNMTVSPVE